ncbi:MAG: NHL repeat-containing protein [Myxococcales bacterium]|nr:NHL repeat-containing protein [Myxococcales bacterium]
MSATRRRLGRLRHRAGAVIEPSSVELSSDGTVIVAGHEDRVQRFDRDGSLIDVFGSSGSGDGQFNHPHGLAVDRKRDDLIYVGDQENNRLQVFSADAKFVRQWGDAQFQHIHDVGIDRATGDVFVGDLETHTLRKFSATGTLLATYGGPGSEPGKFDGLWGVSTDSTGAVYVGDTGNRRVQKLGRDGRFIAEWKDHGGTPFVKPTGVYVDDSDRVYVCDSLAQLVIVFDTAGGVLARWDMARITGTRTEPEDLVIDAAGQHVYVAEVFGHRVYHLVTR